MVLWGAVLVDQQPPANCWSWVGSVFCCLNCIVSGANPGNTLDKDHWLQDCACFLWGWYFHCSTGTARDILQNPSYLALTGTIHIVRTSRAHVPAGRGASYWHLKTTSIWVLITLCLITEWNTNLSKSRVSDFNCCLNWTISHIHRFDWITWIWFNTWQEIYCRQDIPQKNSSTVLDPSICQEEGTLVKLQLMANILIL